MKDGSRHAPDRSVYEYIKSRIISRNLFPGARLVEAQLAEETGVSRTPIREALRKFSYEGIISIVPRKGAYVSKPTYKEIQAVYECKKALEGAAIEKACGHMDEEDTSVLEGLIEKQTAAHRNKNLEDYLGFNDDFHLLIAKASKNPVYEKYIKELTEVSNVYLVFYDNFIFTSVSESEALAGHREILHALNEQDKQVALEAMNSHNQTTLDQLNLV